MGDKPWSSGRILTPSQRERKRKIDKALKREKRKRTADMEARLYRLELLSSSQLGLFTSLYMRICGMAYTLSSERSPPFLMRLTHDHLERSRERNPQSSVTKYLALPCSTEKYWVPCLEDIEFNENESTDDRVEVTNEQDRREIGQYLPCNDFVYDAKNHPIPPLRTAIPQTFHLSQLQNSILGLVHSLNSTQVCTDETVNQDALIRGVTDGWHTLQDSYDPCPLWDILRKLDECIFFQAPMLSRLSLLKGAHMLLLVCRTLSAYTCSGHIPAQSLLVPDFS